MTGIPMLSVDCGAPGRSIRYTARALFGDGSVVFGPAPFFQSAKAFRIAASTASASKRPTT